MEEITLYDYLAYGSDTTKQSVMDLMQGKGYQVNPRDEKELSQCIAQYVQCEGTAQSLATIHPDRDLILQSAAPVSTAPKEKKTDGVKIKFHAPEQNNSLTTQTIMATGLLGLMLVALVVIAKQ